MEEEREVEEETPTAYAVFVFEDRIQIKVPLHLRGYDTWSFIEGEAHEAFRRYVQKQGRVLIEVVHNTAHPSSESEENENDN